MKKLLVILLFSTLLIFLPHKTLYAVSLAYNEQNTIESGTLSTGIDYKSVTATTTTDGGTTSLQRVSYVKIDKDSNAFTVAWSKTSGTSIVGANLIELAQDYELKNPGFKVLAGINGDYYDLTTKTPVNAFVSNGNVIKYNNFSQPRYFSIGLNQDDKGYVSNKTNTIEDLFSLSFYDTTKTRVIKEITIQGLNQIPLENQTTLYFKPLNAISIPDATLYQGSVTSTTNYSSLYLLGKVNQVVTTVSTATDVFTIATKDPEVISLLNKYPQIRLQKHMADVYESVDQIIGVGSQPLENGTVKAFADINDQNLDFAIARHPRTSIGYSDQGDIILMTVDGRQTNMAGANLREEAQIMKTLGASNSFNLDGGGSTQLVIRDGDEFRMLNSPSDNPYRKVSNGILLVVPDVYVDINISNINNTGFDYNIEIDDRSSTINDINVYLNQEEVEYQLGSNTITNLESNGIYYLTADVNYTIGSTTQTVTFIQKRVNLANHYVDISVQKVKPFDFNVSFERSDAIQGFIATISFSDPDKTLTKLYLVHDNQKYIVLNSVNGYQIDFQNVMKNQLYQFTVEYYYRINTITPVSETDAQVFEYTFIEIEEPITTTTQVTTSPVNPSEPNEPTNLTALFIGIISTVGAGLIGTMIWFAKRKIMK